MTVTIAAQQVSRCFTLRRNRAGSLKERFLGIVHPSRRETHEAFWALRDVTLTLARGESLGLVGRNGSGKSTFLKLIAGVYRPTTGHLLVLRGARIGTMIEIGIGFHGELTGKENVFLNASIHGLRRTEIEAMYDRIVRYSGLDAFMDVPLKNFSSGMHMRLAFAVSIHLDPDILLLDEVFAVGDADFQQQCISTMRDFRDRGKTIIFVSHAPAAVQLICQRVCVLEAGRLQYDGPVDRGLREYAQLLADTATASVDARRLDVDVTGATTGSTHGESTETPWHRQLAGGHWAEGGAWQFDFLRRQGLTPHHYVLDVGCGSLAGGLHLLKYMEPSHYWGLEHNSALFEAGVTLELAPANVPPERGHFVINNSFDLSSVPYGFDFAIANSLFARAPLHTVAQVMVNVTRQLVPGGRFFATWFDNADPANLAPLARPGGFQTYPDVEPYHRSFSTLASLCETLGARAERLDEDLHPRGESVMVITKR